MKRTPAVIDPKDFPEELCELLKEAKAYDSSSSMEARVYFIDKGAGCFMKVGEKGTLEREALMDNYFNSLGIGAPVLNYLSSDKDYLLTEMVSGEDLTDGIYLSDGKWLAEKMGEVLRQLHEMRPIGCPVKDRVSEYLGLAEKNFRSGEYDNSAFPDSFGYRSAEEAYAFLKENEKILKSDTLIHGDFCLPNIIFKDKRLSGYIDLGNAGIGDRHIDIFWGAWTLFFNLRTDEFTDRFLDAYGRDRIDNLALRTVAAAEVFG